MKGFVFSLEAILSATIVITIIIIVGMAYFQIEKNTTPNKINHYSETQIATYWYPELTKPTTQITQNNSGYCSNALIYNKTEKQFSQKKVCTVIR